jgi:hypothetical protein
MTTKHSNWFAHQTNPDYIVKFGVKDGLVRIKPSGDKGYLWQCGAVYGFAESVEAAKDMVEGTAVITGNK